MPFAETPVLGVPGIDVPAEIFLFYSGNNRLDPVPASDIVFLITPTGNIALGGKQNDVGGKFNSILGGNNNSISLDSINSFIAAGSGNILVKTEGSFILGGQNNLVTGVLPTTGSAIAAGIYNYISGSNSYIGAGINNKIFSSGGLYRHNAFPEGNIARNYIGGSSINGGQNNIISGYNAHIGGGSDNFIIAASVRDPDLAPFNQININSAILGGSGNEVSSFQTNVIGGAKNKAGFIYSSVIAGSGNYARGCQGTIQGGVSNYAGGPTSSIIGGDSNCTIGGFSFGANTFIGGGRLNRMENSLNGVIFGGSENCINNGIVSVIFGGQKNRINGQYSFIAGGFNNNISSSYTSVLGGINNEGSISASGGFILGSNSILGHDGAMILADGSSRIKNTRANHSLTLSFSGGVIFVGKDAGDFLNVTGLIV